MRNVADTGDGRAERCCQDNGPWSWDGDGVAPRDGYVSNPFVANTGTYADDASLAVNARCVGQLLSDA